MEYEPTRKEIFKEMGKDSLEFGNSLIGGIFLGVYLPLFIPFLEGYSKKLKSQNFSKNQKSGMMTGNILGFCSNLFYTSWLLKEKEFEWPGIILATNVLSGGIKFYYKSRNKLLENNKKESNLEKEV